MNARRPKRFFWQLLLVIVASLSIHGKTPDHRILSYVVDPAKQDIQLYWKDDSGTILGSIQRVKEFLTQHHKTLVFAMNGGMFRADHSPQGLYIQQGRMVTPLDTLSGNGNFYLKPNGVFFVTTKKQAHICSTAEFSDSGQVWFATQSGPMLLEDGVYHPAFKQGSANLNIRNGVGILPDGRLLFAMSKEPVNFYDFANFFKLQGCQNALYLDGFVSRTYLPEKEWMQTDGDFGVIIAVSAP